MLIMQVYHDFGRMPDSRPKMRLWLYARLWSKDMTPIVYPDSGHTSRLRSTSRIWSYLLTPVVHHGSDQWADRISYHLSYERLHINGLDDCSILQLEHLVRSRLGGVHNSFNIWNLSISWLRMFKCQAMCYATDEHLARLDLRETRVSRRTRYPCNSCGSRYSNVWSGEPRLYATWSWH
jgi:hypothetical protein